MTKKNEKLDFVAESVGLADELIQAFRKSEAYSKAKDDNCFAATFTSGIAIFTATILKSLCLSTGGDDYIYNAYIRQILPRAFEIVGETTDSNPSIQAILQYEDEVGS